MALLLEDYRGPEGNYQVLKTNIIRDEVFRLSYIIFALGYRYLETLENHSFTYINLG